MKKKISLVMVLSLLTVNISFATENFKYQAPTQIPEYQQNYYPNQQYSSNGATLKGRVITIPTCQELMVMTPNQISSETSYVGQSYTLTLTSDFCYNGTLIAPAGSYVLGNVVEVSKAKHGSMNGKLLLRFNQIITPSGHQIPISAIIKTTDNTGVLVGGTKLDVAKEYGKDAAVGTAVGALSGVVFGALAGGSVGKGAALGAAVGAGGGLTKSIIDKGKDVNIPAGATFELTLTQPVTVTPTAIDY